MNRSYQLNSRPYLPQIAIAVGLAWAAADCGAIARSLPTAPPQRAIDTKILPGKRVGAITPATTYADLVKLFGKKKLSQRRFYSVEGAIQLPSTAISTGRNRSIAVVWKNDRRLQPVLVTIDDPAWRTADGIGIGTSLAKLRQAFGEFKISGLYWDYGNQVMGLSAATKARYPGLSLIVDADYTAGRRFPKDLKAVTGDKAILSASNPHWQPLKIHVTSMSVRFVQPKPPRQPPPRVKK